MRISFPWVMTNGIKTYMITPRGSMDLRGRQGFKHGRYDFLDFVEFI